MFLNGSVEMEVNVLGSETILNVFKAFSFYPVTHRRSLAFFLQICFAVASIVNGATLVVAVVAHPSFKSVTGFVRLLESE
jgi:hypothetical protein